MFLKLIRSMFLKKKFDSQLLKNLSLLADKSALEAQLAGNEAIFSSHEANMHSKKADEIRSSLQLSLA